MKFFCLLFAVLLASCSGQPVNLREPNALTIKNCSEGIKEFFQRSKSKEEDLLTVLAKKNQLTITDKLVLINYPSVDWINKVKASFNLHLKNWNNNQYPAFYLFSPEEVSQSAKTYAANFEKIAKNEVSVSDDNVTKSFVQVSDWMKSFANYKKDIDDMIEERISLQYNIEMLKKIKLRKDEVRDIEIVVKRNGELKKEIIALRKDDKNLEFTIRSLKKQMKDLDGTLQTNGKIKERIIRQAMLQDILIIVSRELEYASKNSIASEEMLQELKTINSLIKNSDFKPSSFGVYKITTQIFIRELFNMFNADILYKVYKNPVEEFKNVLSYFLKEKDARPGVLEKVYAKITHITPKQVAVAGGAVTVAGIGANRYFWFKDRSVEEIDKKPTDEKRASEDEAHIEQIEETKKLEETKEAEREKVIGHHIEEIFIN